MSTKRGLKILVLAAEVAPFAKVGGLADVAGALPKELARLGHDVRVAMPAYKMIEDNPAFDVTSVLPSFPVPIDEKIVEQGYVRQTSIKNPHGPDVPVYLVGHTATRANSPRPPVGEGSGVRVPGAQKIGYFQGATESKKVYIFAPEPYVFFARAVLEMIPLLSPEWVPDLIHCNDWHTGLLPVFQQAFYAGTPVGGAATLFTVHNLAYQGNFKCDKWPATGLPKSFYAFDKLEFYGEWSFMKGGLTFADRVNTVSRTYADEIQTMEFGCGLDGLMRYLKSEGRLSGILNGIDYDEFNPETDPNIPAHFSAADVSGKAVCKKALQTELGLEVGDAPVIGMVTRLADQKGLDLIYAAATKIMELPIQLVVLGTGDPTYEKYFTKLQAKQKGRVHARIGFDLKLAQRIYAGSDMFLMPSRFEPCGLGQLISLRYGSIPIVRSVGGLADTVFDVDGPNAKNANGFAFEDYRPEALLDAVTRAVETYGNRAKWDKLVLRAVKFHSSWGESAKLYAALYSDAVTTHAARSKNAAARPTGK